MRQYTQFTSRFKMSKESASNWSWIIRIIDKLYTHCFAQSLAPVTFLLINIHDGFYQKETSHFILLDTCRTSIRNYFAHFMNSKDREHREILQTSRDKLFETIIRKEKDTDEKVKCSGSMCHNRTLTSKKFHSFIITSIMYYRIAGAYGFILCHAIGEDTLRQDQQRMRRKTDLFSLYWHGTD